MSVTLHTAVGCNGPDLDNTKPADALVSIAGSAGAFHGLWRLLSKLPSDLNAAVAVVLHTGHGSLLASTLATRSRLMVREAISGDLLRAGYAYVPPPQIHLVINPDARLSVSDAPRIGFFRPSADWLFASAAASFTSRHVAVVLSGLLSDGARQLPAVKRLGGTVIVEDPARARHRNMPAAAIATGCVDVVVGIDDMAQAICEAVARQHAASDSRMWESPFEVGANSAEALAG